MLDVNDFDQLRIGLATAVALPGLHSTASAMGKPASLGSSETLVATLYKSLTPQQQQVVAFPFDHPLRSKVDNNWHITPAKIGEFFTADQQAMIMGGSIAKALKVGSYAG